MKRFGSVFLIFCFCAARGIAQTTAVDPGLDNFVKGFKSRGEMGDGSKPLRVDEAMKGFRIAPGLKLDVVAHEPEILKPIEARFDERGRLWVVQYLQFPFPAGLKVLKYDEYLRAIYDKVPEPPPRGVKGRDRITILEDRDGDGVFETRKDFLMDLNMATSVLPGRGGVWVMNSPYLLFYADKNHEDVPEGDPEVRLSGFGLEDTHALANGLRWGPDGWLYGCTGSTITSTVRGIHWLGQAIWRYQPETDAFEIFCEGGGNTWAIEFDSEGRMFTGTNYDTFRGLHMVQGGSYVKNFAKHGPLMNPYAFGYFEHMRNTQTERLTHVSQPFLIYEGNAFPARFDHHVISGIALSNRMQCSALRPVGSTFETLCEEPLVSTEDRWFRPVSLSAGPDGGVYFCDWYDSRLTNLDPRDTWDHEHGRVYRLRAEEGKPAAPFDLAKQSGEELIETLHNPNKWWRETAIRVLYDRHDTSLAPGLRQRLAESRGQFALECLWALNACGGFDEAAARQCLEHPEEFVRAWGVRLLGDPGKAVSPAIATALSTLAAKEPSVHVRSQLASTLKRLPAENALPVLRVLMTRAEDADDPHIPLLLWWALESKVAGHGEEVLAMMRDPALWSAPLAHLHIVPRLGQRFTADRRPESLETAARLLAMAPTPEATDALIAGMEKGLQGDRLAAIPDTLRQQAARAWDTRPHTPTLIGFAMRLDHPPAADAAVAMQGDARVAASARKELLRLLAERKIAAAVPVLLKLFVSEKSETARIDLLNALAHFDSAEIGRTLLEAVPTLPPRVRAVAITTLAGRAAWARGLLALVDRGALKTEYILPGDLMVIQKLGDPETDALLKKNWGNLRATSEEKEILIKNLRMIVARAGNAENGRVIFRAVCAACHTLNGEGAKIGPDLTGYERDNLDFLLPAIVDPSLGIREEYIVYTLKKKDGQVLVGFVTESTPQFVSIKDPAGTVTKVAREEMDSLTASPVSLMPEGLLNALTSEQTRDLFTYLRSK